MSTEATVTNVPQHVLDYLAEHKAALDVAFSLEQNQYNGETYVELTLADLKSAAPEILTPSDPDILRPSDS